MRSRSVHYQANMPRFSSLIQQALVEVFEHSPYPTIPQKHALMQQHSLSRQQVNNWFVNARQRRGECASVEGCDEEREEEREETIVFHRPTSEPSAIQIDRWMRAFDEHAFEQILHPIHPRFVEWMYDRVSTHSQLWFLIDSVNEDTVDIHRIESACVSVRLNSAVSSIGMVQQHAIDRGHIRTALYLEEVMDFSFRPR